MKKQTNKKKLTCFKIIIIIIGIGFTGTIDSV
jgi:hypothetical protein